jgi:UDP-4-amino-4,6-dideoxy-N-acetyl-beta-L-altrosamine N-acetyltransferase
VIISKYGVQLIRLTEDKIELVRQWRNHEKIKAVMDFQDYISPEMQKLWFDKINNHHHFYFIISYKGEEIGLIHTADINYTTKTAWSGLFIANQDYINSTVPIVASLTMLDFFMSENNIIDTLYAKVMNINEKALGYNLNLGFEIEDENSSDKYKIIALHSKKYMAKSKSLKKVFQRWYSDFVDLNFDNMNFEDAQEFMKKIKNQSNS